jgi:hypothetical protein
MKPNRLITPAVTAGNCCRRGVYVVEDLNFCVLKLPAEGAGGGHRRWFTCRVGQHESRHKTSPRILQGVGHRLLGDPPQQPAPEKDPRHHGTPRTRTSSPKGKPR